MAAVEVMISGVLYDKTARTARPVMLVGEASLAGLGVGGGPIMPPPGGGGDPPHIWGGGNEPFPTPPIHIPPQQPPTGPADDNGFIKPPPEGGGWGYHADYGWLYSPKAGQAGPK